jgi:copper chaperone CopZ
MHCASCEYLIEKLTPQTPGILAAASSYASGTVKITYDPALIDEAQLPAAIARAGYRARLHDEAAPEHDERPELLRLLTAGCLASPVMMLTLLFVYPVHGGFVQPEDYAAIGWLAFHGDAAGTVRIYHAAGLLCRLADPAWRMDRAARRRAQHGPAAGTLDPRRVCLQHRAVVSRSARPVF